MSETCERRVYSDARGRHSGDAALREPEGRPCPMCDGTGRIEGQETVVVPSQGAYRTIGGWVTKDALSMAPIATFALEVESPGQEAAQDPSDGRRSRHDRSQQTTPSTSSPI